MGASPVAIVTFALLAWATSVTYRTAPPQPDRFVTASGTVVMTADDIFAGKGGFQKADLMDYGSLYGMGSYYGEDYTASTLVRLGVSDARTILRCRYRQAFAGLPADQQAAATAAMQQRAARDRPDQRRSCCRTPSPRLPWPSATRSRKSLSVADPPRGWTPAYSLNPQLRRADGGFPGVLRADHGGTPARPDLVLDRELAL